MKRALPIFLGLSLIVACTKTESEKPTSVIVKKESRMTSPKMNTEFSIGEEVAFQFDAGELQIDSVVVSGPDFSQKFSGGSFSWTPQTGRTGRFNFNAAVYCNGNVETHYPRLIMLSDVEPEQLTYEVINTYPHSTSAYTQGLFFLGEDLIESTGQTGESVIKKVKLESGQELINTPIGDEYFGEGSTLYNDEIYMVTWTSQVGFVFDTNLNQQRSFQYAMQGWGLTTIGDSLLMTDGSEKMYFMNPGDFSEIDHLEVYNNETAVDNLNELELIGGQVYANEWQTDNVHVIDPSSGKILKTIDFSGLLTPLEQQSADVLNGIAYHAGTNRLFVTGKNWPKIFEVKLKPKNTNL